MHQDAFDRIYDSLEAEITAPATRATPTGAGDLQPFIDLDRARFAIERGETALAIGILQHLQAAVAASGRLTRGAGAIATLQQIEAIEDTLHAAIRLGSAGADTTAALDRAPEDQTATRAASRNAKVIRSTVFADIAAEYVRLFETARIRDEQRSTVGWYVGRIIANRGIYQEIEQASGVPWWFTGLIHGMECSFSTRKHLHNGDPLSSRTRQEPPGRPEDGTPPFGFFDSAVDALDYDGFTDQTDWDLANVLYRLESYNGFGYRRKFGTVSPYLWSFCNHYVAGKYVRDGVYDADAVSGQCGTAATLRALVEQGVVSFAAPEPDGVPAIEAGPEYEAGPSTVPAPVADPVATPPSEPVEQTDTAASAPAPVGASEERR